MNIYRVTAVDIKGRVRRTLFSAKHFLQLVEAEIKSDSGLPLAKRWYMWKRGFLSQSYNSIDVENNDCSEYLSDWNRYLKTPFINGKYSIVLNHKVIFAAVMQQFF